MAGPSADFLVTYQRDIQQIVGTIRALRIASKPRSPDEANTRADEIRRAGRPLGAFGRSFQQRLRSIMRGEHGLRLRAMEEINLIHSIVGDLNDAVVAYRQLVGTKVAPVPWRNPREDPDLQVFISRTIVDRVTLRLIQSGARDVLNAAAWLNRRDEIARLGLDTVNGTLVTAFPRLVGPHGHDARSARRALRISANQEMCGDFARVLVEITGRRVWLRVGREIRIRRETMWLEADRIASGLPIEARLGSSLRMMDVATRALDGLPDDAGLERIEGALQEAWRAVTSAEQLSDDLTGGTQTTTAQQRALWERVHDEWGRTLASIRSVLKRFLFNKETVGRLLSPLDPIISEALVELDALIWAVKPMLEGVGELTPEEVFGSWTFGRVGGAELCTVNLTRTPDGPGYKLQACHDNESFWQLEGRNTIVFFHRDGKPTSRLTRVSRNCWRGLYLGHDPLPADGTVHYIRRGPASDEPNCR
jgi:hypothetical protein